MHRTTAFVFGILLLFAIETAVGATTITVTNTNDSGPASLRQALVQAKDGDTIEFAVIGTIALTSAELVIDKSITINGLGANLLAVSQPLNAQFRCSMSRPVTLSTYKVSQSVKVMLMVTLAEGS